VLEKRIPGSTDHISWLILAQHFGLPTRLLDWTESILVGLWFSVNTYHTNEIKNETDDSKEDAELWVMRPGSLNKYHKNEFLHDDIALGENSLVQYLAEQPMVREEMRYQKAVKKDWKEKYGREFKFPQYPIAFVPQRTFQRQASQLSVFTIHPRPKKGKSIEEILKNKKDLSSFIIPGESKEELRRELLHLGITKRMLFQDLESLSYDILNEVL